MIEVKNVTKKYGKLTAVDDVSFTIKEGEITGLPVMSGDAENKKQLTEILGSINNSLIKIASEKGNETTVSTLPLKPYYVDMFGDLDDSN